MTSEAAISSTSFISWGLSSASSLDDFDARVGALLRTVRALSARPIAGQSSGDGGDGDGAGYRRRGRSRCRAHLRGRAAVGQEECRLRLVGTTPAALLVQKQTANMPTATALAPTAGKTSGSEELTATRIPTKTPATTAVTAATAVAACDRWCHRECFWPVCRITACGSSPALSSQ